MADSLGVDIINTSLGYFTYDNPNYSYTYADMNGTKAFISRGQIWAFSKGMICSNKCRKFWKFNQILILQLLRMQVQL